MYERKYIMFLKHWTHSGLVIMCNEDINPQDAMLKYDVWIQQRRYDKYEHYHKDNSEDHNEDNNEDEDEDEDEDWTDDEDDENENESGSEENDSDNDSDNDNDNV